MALNNTSFTSLPHRYVTQSHKKATFWDRQLRGKGIAVSKL